VDTSTPAPRRSGGHGLLGHGLLGHGLLGHGLLGHGLLGTVGGVRRRLLLPASALMVVCPMIAATVLAAVEGGRAQVATLWRRSVDVPAARYAGWVAAVALLPALVLLATLLDRGSVALPPGPVPLVAVPLLAVVYLAAALAEEVGWTASLTDRVLLRLGTAGTGLVLGAVWAAWHLVPYAQAGRDARWIAWQCLVTVAARVLIVEVYAGSGRCVPTPSSCTPASTSPPRRCPEPARTSTRRPWPRS
jgi:membrane protease YdiL (CAAX protease family)